MSTMIFWTIAVLLGIFSSVVGESSPKNLVEINLESNWVKPSFKLKLLETLPSVNASSYVAAVATLLQLQELEDGTYEIPEDIKELTDEEAHQKVLELLGDSVRSYELRAYFDVYLANNYFSPRIISHIQYYRENVLSEFESKLRSCSSDFDASSASDNSIPSSWVLYNNYVICNPFDIFALKTSHEKRDDSLILKPFDRIIGSSTTAPLAVLYGDIDDPKFKEYFVHLYSSAKLGKIRFVWRYAKLPSANEESEKLGGYGADMTLKRTDYIVIDDRDIKSPVKNLDGKENELSAEKDSSETGVYDKTPMGFTQKVHKNINGLTKKQIKTLGLRVSNFILNRVSMDPFEKFNALTEILNNFPKFAYDIATSKHFKINKKTDAKYAKFLETLKTNAKLGVNTEMKGLYVNGKELDYTKYNIYDLLKLIDSETEFIKRFGELNLSPIASKGFIGEFARLSAVSSSRSTGADNSMRYEIHENSEDVIVYFNDLAKDADFAHFSLDRRLWLDPQGSRRGMFPKYRENVLELVFAINLSNRRLMRVVYQIANSVVARGIAHRVGIIPIILNEDDQYYDLVVGESLTVDGMPVKLDRDEMRQLDRALMNDFYRKAKKLGTKSVKFLEYVKSLQDDSYLSEVWSEYLENPSMAEEYDNSAYLSQFSLDEGMIIVDGVFHPFNIFDATWQSFISSQLVSDVDLIGQFIRAGRIPITTSDEKTLTEYLHEDSPRMRNTLIVPHDSSDIQYADIDAPFLGGLNLREEQMFVFVTENVNNTAVYTHYSMLLIGDYGSTVIKDQMIQILRFALSEVKKGDKATFFTKHRFVNTGSNNSLIKQLKEIFANEKVDLTEKLRESIETVTSFESIDTVSHSDEKILEVLQKAKLKVSDDAMVIFNSRKIEVPSTKILTAEIFDYMIELEKKERLFDYLFQNIESFEKEHKFISQIGIDRFDYNDLFFSVLTKTYHEKSPDYEAGTPRYQLSLMNFNDISFVVSDDVETAKNYSAIEIVAVIDPIEEKSQKLVSLLGSLTTITKNTNDIHMTILFAPDSAMTEIPIKRFYKGLYLPAVKFVNGSLDESIYDLKFENVPEETLFTLDLDLPHSWIALAKESKYDLDNIKLDLTEEREIHGVYELDNIIIEGYSSVSTFMSTPRGIQLQVSPSGSDTIYSDTIVMANYGYFQLKANPGLWELSIKPDSRSSEIFSFEPLKEDHISAVKLLDPQTVQIGVFDMSGIVYAQSFVKNPGKEEELLISDDEDEIPSVAKKAGGFLSSLWGSKPKKTQADINIMAVASGHLYERLLSIMTASVRNHTEHTVKFWLIDNYMSANFRSFLPTLAEKYNFEYELITYKWPLWLRDQREKQRTIWGYKILFLDVLFPQDLDKVIFVDADQIVRTDLQELVDLDLHGAPYGYTPMCDSREEMEGFRFWKKGYWKEVLGQSNLKYHISALYVVDLQKFRSIAAGDQLRQHYQQLSADPASLSNLDQDLPNNLQHRIKIFSLPQEWLWCETWCSDESLAKAKTIDLCNNPLTKEPKLDRARRQIPEWTVYDTEIGALLEEHKSAILEQNEKKTEVIDESDKGVEEDKIVGTSEDKDISKNDDGGQKVLKEEKEHNLHDEL